MLRVFVEELIEIRIKFPALVVNINNLAFKSVSLSPDHTVCTVTVECFIYCSFSIGWQKNGRLLDTDVRKHRARDSCEETVPVQRMDLPKNWLVILSCESDSLLNLNTIK